MYCIYIYIYPPWAINPVSKNLGLQRPLSFFGGLNFLDSLDLTGEIDVQVNVLGMGWLTSENVLGTASEKCRRNWEQKWWLKHVETTGRLKYLKITVKNIHWDCKNWLLGSERSRCVWKHHKWDGENKAKDMSSVSCNVNCWVGCGGRGRECNLECRKYFLWVIPTN